jgi:hypothetical protein
MWQSEIKVRQAAAIVACVAAIVLAADACSSHTRSEDATLSVVSDPTGGCRYAGSGDPWAELLREPTEFALDYVHLSGGDHVTIESVALVGQKGMRLVHAALVPGGGLGSAFAWNDPKFIQFPTAWTQRVSPPDGSLNASQNLVGLPRHSDGRTWEIVVAVLPTTLAGGSADHVEVTYSSGVRTVHLAGQDDFGVFKTAAQCSST